THFITVIPANVYGINDHFDPSRGHVIASLIRRFHDAKVSGWKSVSVWGSGRPKREFLYVDDLAEACIFLMNTYDSSEIINVGTGQDTSITELAELIRETVGFTGKISYDESKPDGMPSRLLDVSRITSLGWRPRVKLREGLRLTYEFFEEMEALKHSAAGAPRVLQD
ncbi:MAG: NAD-dependent epimerase/dehydratase family protein, partial [Candidatus Brocadiales bacterium]